MRMFIYKERWVNYVIILTRAVIISRSQKRPASQQEEDIFPSITGNRTKACSLKQWTKADL